MNYKLSVSPDVVLGKNVKHHSYCNIYGCEIGDNTKTGAFVEIQKGAKIGACCKISSHFFICEGVTIEDAVVIGHRAIFVNDRYPRAVNSIGSLQMKSDWERQCTLVKRGASIGSGAPHPGGITIGANSLVGTGSVLTNNVPADGTVVGNPARIINRE